MLRAIIVTVLPKIIIVATIIVLLSHRQLLVLHLSRISSKILKNLIRKFIMDLLTSNNCTRTSRTVISMHCAILSKHYCYRHQCIKTNHYLLIKLSLLLILLLMIMITIKSFLKYSVNLHRLWIYAHRNCNILQLARPLLRINLLILRQNIHLLLFHVHLHVKYRLLV